MCWVTSSETEIEAMLLGLFHSVVCEVHVIDYFMSKARWSYGETMLGSGYCDRAGPLFLAVLLIDPRKDSSTSTAKHSNNSFQSKKYSICSMLAHTCINASSGMQYSFNSDICCLMLNHILLLDSPLEALALRFCSSVFALCIFRVAHCTEKHLKVICWS